MIFNPLKLPKSEQIEKEMMLFNIKITPLVIEQIVK